MAFSGSHEESVAKCMVPLAMCLMYTSVESLAPARATLVETCCAKKLSSEEPLSFSDSVALLEEEALSLASSAVDLGGPLTPNHSSLCWRLAIATCCDWIPMA